MAGDFFDEDDYVPRSPRLEPIIVKPLKRSPSPGLWPTDELRQKRRRQKKLSSDTEVLIDHMGGLNYPDVARLAGDDVAKMARVEIPDRSDDNSFSSSNRDGSGPNLASPRKRQIGQDNVEASSYGKSASPLQKLKVDLPMIIRGKTIISRPDSGTEENIIASEVTSALGLAVDTTPEHRKDFRMANGVLVQALGRLVIDCTFARDRTVQLSCIFYVFRQLICPILMGMPFLSETRTLDKYRHRLQARTPPSFAPLQLSLLNKPRQRLYCLANCQPKFANADTGSELNLMSLAYVRQRRFLVTGVELGSSMVQFADGSTAYLEGCVNVTIVLGTPEAPRIAAPFYVLRGLTCDVLFGEDFLHETKAFTEYRHAFAMVPSDDDIAEVNGIMWFRTMEEHVSNGMAVMRLSDNRESGRLPFPCIRFCLVSVRSDSRQIRRKRPSYSESNIVWIVSSIAK